MTGRNLPLVVYCRDGAGNTNCFVVTAHGKPEVPLCTVEHLLGFLFYGKPRGAGDQLRTYGSVGVPKFAVLPHHLLRSDFPYLTEHIEAIQERSPQFPLVAG